MLPRPILPAPRRSVLKVADGLAGILALGRAPAIAQTQPKKLIIARITPPPESGAVALSWLADQVNERSKGELLVEFHGGTLLTKEIDVLNGVKSGNIAMGTPSGAAATIFPEMGVFLVPYLISSYTQAYKILNGKVGDNLDRIFQEKYGVKALFYFDYGFRHFWNSKRAINEPRDLRGLKLRTQPSKVFTDTVNGLGAVAVPLGWAEVITAAQQGVIDGADLPVVNMVPLKAYEVSKYYSMTGHNYGSTLVAFNLAMWNGLTADQQKLLLDVGRGAQDKVRGITESIDSEKSAKEQLEQRVMIVNVPDREPFKKLAREKVWPAYQKQYAELWEQIGASACPELCALSDRVADRAAGDHLRAGTVVVPAARRGDDPVGPAAGSAMPHRGAGLASRIEVVHIYVQILKRQPPWLTYPFRTSARTWRAISIA